jgi:hypothetical protein
VIANRLGLESVATEDALVAALAAEAA